MNSCPCCTQQMVLYAGNNRLYWYCCNCRQEMPDLLNVMLTARQKHQKPSNVQTKKEVAIAT
ncbi:hypothetical protein IQ249_02990 [Lusitaniella coriacea LEGE 07157]|uniref:Uncharacterized protein n=1 Tax=Lusitaniella coriacea LEGE 07157 TaxID=945747 RepID=A0A8J7B0F3_9CYAN|nr:hypothetical protein [Lusitaniella coriacea]MBE9114855.1 hypothetical protein [Lusitaniella coriacea LEGE 07157]